MELNICLESLHSREHEQTGQMLYFLQKSEEQGTIKLKSKKGGKDKCPYQSGDGCLRHNYRPTGCRIFYCDGIDKSFQAEMTEQVLERLRRMHEELGAVYYYGDVLEWLVILG